MGMDKWTNKQKNICSIFRDKLSLPDGSLYCVLCFAFHWLGVYKFAPISTNTMMYLLLLLEVAGNILVWSVYIAYLALKVLTYMSYIFLGGGLYVVVLSDISCSRILVDLMLWCCFFMCPFAVLFDSGKCLLTVFTVTQD
jgi:hypothetical protein